MSKTELEDDLRATLERAAASVPPTPDLALRATTDARRARRRTAGAYGAAVAGVAAVAAAGYLVGGSGGGATDAAQPAASPTTVTTAVQAEPAALSAQSLAGTWRPLKMDGFTTLKTSRPEAPNLTFRSDGTWTGSDGCNGISGTFSIGQRGEFTGQANGQRLIECANVPHTGVLLAARRVAVDPATLRFFATDGREVAVYARAG